MRCLVIALLLCPLAFAAQTRPARKAAPAKPAAPAAWPIESIAIDGAREYTREQILTAAHLKVGQMASAADFDAARQRLEAAGVFDEAGVKFGPAGAGKGYAVTILVREAGPFFPVRFEGLDAPAAELTRALRQADPFFGPRIPATESTLARYTQVIQAYLAAQNRPAKVTGKLIPDDAGQMAVVFRPVVALPVIARVRFLNTQAVRTSTIENAINAVAVGTPYQEERLRQALDLNIRPIYENHGRVRVAFPEFQTEKEKDVAGLVVTVKVEEGPVYSLGEVTVDGSSLPPAELNKIAALKPGEPFNLEQIQAAAARIEKRIRRNGFIQVKTRIDRRIDDAAKKVALALHVDDGPRYLFGKLTIQGLDIIGEPAVRKMWAIQEGQPFNADYPDHFLNAVREEGMFDDLGETKAVIHPNDAARTVDVTLIFRVEVKPVKKPGEPGS